MDKHNENNIQVEKCTNDITNFPSIKFAALD